MGWIVKLKRTGFETVIAGPDEKKIISMIAANLNDQYQTDEYRVEEWLPERFDSYRTARPTERRIS